MEAQSYTAEERRAANQVWAAAGAYGFEPLFLARNTDGTIDFYMNCVVGLVHKYYGDELVRSLFDAWEGDIRQAMLDDLTWLYLESAVYALELPRRPVLSALRRAMRTTFSASSTSSRGRSGWRRTSWSTPCRPRAGGLCRAHAAGHDSLRKGSRRRLSPETPPKPDELKAALLAVYAKFGLFNGTVHQKAGLHLHLDGLLASLMTRTHAHPDDKDRPGHGGAFRLGGRLRRRHPRRQAAGPHHPAPARRGRPRLHRKLLWPVALPARMAAEGRARSFAPGSIWLSPLVASGVPSRSRP